MSGDIDPYYYARNHEGGPGSWCVRGPLGFEMQVTNLDKNIAYIIRKLLSEKLEVAGALEMA